MEAAMSVKLSPKYQIVIPEDVRKSLDVKPGQQFEVFAINGCIEIVPVPTPKEARGLVRGIDTRIVREKDRL
jgi:AbrB family looped-hinge helix DNA binding protein